MTEKEEAIRLLNVKDCIKTVQAKMNYCAQQNNHDGDESFDYWNGVMKELLTIAKFLNKPLSPPSIYEAEKCICCDKEKQKLCDDMKNLTLSKQEREEFDNIAKNQPVFSGNVIGKHTARQLIDKGLVMYYEGEYVLTNKGQQLKENLISAQKLVDSGILYKK